jgi:BirA family transcriptional regulator, biotin operon repressor / biotin---[acetyl-CoA-carboxylase] ligase
VTATWLGARRVDLPVCGSTSDEAAALARAGAAHGTVVTADRQESGRGRQGRAWHSPPGANLYLSIVLRPGALRPPLPPRSVPPITLAAGIAVCDAVRAAGVAASLKWPNDVLIGGRKVAGILTEMSSRGAGEAAVVDHVIVGIGVNLNLAPSDIPDELAAIATSIAIERGRAPRRSSDIASGSSSDASIDRAAFTAALLDSLEPWLDRFFAGGVPAIAPAWLERAELSGRRVRAGGIDGSPVGLDPSGALRILDDSGVEHLVVAGDVAILAPAGAHR